MSTIKTSTLSTLDGSYSVPSETLARAACRAWVNFNGTGTVAIRASFNVSSITDNGTGDYTVNFTNALSDEDYSALISLISGIPTGNQVIGAIYSATGVAGAATLKSTTQLRVSSHTTSPTFQAIDVSYFNVAIFR